MTKRKRQAGFRRPALKKGVLAFVKTALMLAVLAVLLAASWYYVFAPVISERVVLRQIAITGNSFTRSSDIIDALGSIRGSALFELDPKRLEARLKETRFIRDVRITRETNSYGSIFSGTLRVEVLSERIPVAKAYLFGKKNWLLSDGDLTPVLEQDKENRFDAARCTPEIYFYSTRQSGSPETTKAVLSILSIIASSAPGIISEMKFDAVGNLQLITEDKFPIRLSSFESPEVSLSNLSDIMRIVRAEPGVYSDLTLTPDGESILKLKADRDNAEAGVGVNSL